MPNESSNIVMEMEGRTSINGGVITAGNVDGTGWNDGTIQHNPTYTQAMNEFVLESAMAHGVQSWTYK